ncbi:MAG: ElyC/SanA/YdcF family protein [Polyangiales bacterium]
MKSERTVETVPSAGPNAAHDAHDAHDDRGVHDGRGDRCDRCESMEREPVEHKRSSGWPRVRRAVALALALLAAFASVFAVRAERAVRRSSEGRVFARAEAPARRVVIVLGARVSPSGRPFAALEDRLLCALDLVRSGRAEYVLVSGDHGRANYDEANAMRRYLVDRGVPSERVYMDHAGFRTLDTMARASALFAVREAAICTNRFHLARSLWLARSFGIDAVGVDADRRVYPARRFDATREWFARVKAVFDTDVIRTAPRYWGERIPIGERGSDATHDARTAAGRARRDEGARDERGDGSVRG